MQSVSATVATMGAKLSQLASQAGTQINSALVAIKGLGLNAINWAKQHPGIAGGIGGTATILILGGVGYGVHSKRAAAVRPPENSGETNPLPKVPVASENPVHVWQGGRDQVMNPVREMLAAGKAQGLHAQFKSDALCNKSQALTDLRAKADLFQTFGNKKATIKSSELKSKTCQAFRDIVLEYQEMHKAIVENECNIKQLEAFNAQTAKIDAIVTAADRVVEGVLNPSAADDKKITQTQLDALDAVLNQAIKEKEDEVAKHMFPSLKNTLTRHANGSSKGEVIWKTDNGDFHLKAKEALGPFEGILGQSACTDMIRAATAYGRAYANWKTPGGAFAAKDKRKPDAALKENLVAAQKTLKKLSEEHLALAKALKPKAEKAKKDEEARQSKLAAEAKKTDETGSTDEKGSKSE